MWNIIVVAYFTGFKSAFYLQLTISLRIVEYMANDIRFIHFQSGDDVSGSGDGALGTYGLI